MSDLGQDSGDFKNDSFFEEEIEEESLEEEAECLRPEDFLKKNTSSFQCLAQVSISRSSLLLDPYYWFPELTNPKLDGCLGAEEPKAIYDKAGKVKYLEMCKQLKIQPYRRILQSLEHTYLDLSYFGLSALEMRALCDALAMNQYVQRLSLHENFLSPESVKFLDGMLLKNNTIQVLDLSNCYIGPEGAKNIRSGFAFNSTVEELDLSFNNLEDDGVAYVAKAMNRNNGVEILNLSHNKLGIEALRALAETIENNYTIMDLNLSWNLLYREDGMTEFMAALLDNTQVQRLDLSWCGIGDKDNMRPLYNYIRSDQATLADLDLSNNRICGTAVTMLKTGLKFNENLQILNLSSNPMTPDEVENLAAVVYEPRGELQCSLKLLDFSNIMVNKTFTKVRNRCHKKGCRIKYEGILSNFKVNLPDIKPILCHRAKFVAATQKKKKFRQDFGLFLLRLPKEPLGRTEVVELMEKYKIKLDNDLMEGLFRTFVNREGEFDKDQLIDLYMKLYPDTQLPPKKPKKKKKKPKPKSTFSEQTFSEATEYTDYTYMSSWLGSEEMEIEEEGESEEGEEEETRHGHVTFEPGVEKIDQDDDTINSDLFKSVLDGTEGTRSEATTVE